MQDDEEAPDAVDVRPSPGPSEKEARPFPWFVLIAGVIVSAMLMAAITLSTVPLCIITSH